MKIHFIGIGGIGVSALARYFLAHENEVSGSDLAASQITDALRREGAKIFIGPHKKSNIKDGVDLVIYSAAATKDNPELKEARARKIKCQIYAQALGDLTKKYFTIAISGMHGKSTTTAMIGLMMEEAGLDPTVIVGTKVKWNCANDAGIALALGHPHQPCSSLLDFFPLGVGQKSRARRAALRSGHTRIIRTAHAIDQNFYSNFRLGKSEYLVIEADEWNASFLNYWPKVMVLTNIEEEHLDYYKNLRKIKETFKEYIGHLRKNGVLVANADDKNVMGLAQSAKRKVQSYSAGDKIDGLKLKIPGQHNLSNAAAVMAVAKILGIDKEVALKALNNFNGTWRRMEYKGEINGAKIYDDYGHHPTEIKATLDGARELMFKGNNFPRPPLILRGKGDPRLWCVFQPHQYQRTYALFKQFVGAFDAADKVVLLPIYSVAGREKESIKKKVSSEKLAEAIKEERGNKEKGEEVIFLPDLKQTEEYLKNNLGRGDICVIMGAGDIYKLTEDLIK